MENDALGELLRQLAEEKATSDLEGRRLLALDGAREHLGLESELLQHFVVILIELALLSTA